MLIFGGFAQNSREMFRDGSLRNLSCYDKIQDILHSISKKLEIIGLFESVKAIGQ